MWWNNEQDAISDALDNANYKELGGKFYCPKCYSYAVINEQDVIVTKDGRRFWDETEEEITIELTAMEKSLISSAAEQKSARLSERKSTTSQTARILSSKSISAALTMNMQNNKGGRNEQDVILRP